PPLRLMTNCATCSPPSAVAKLKLLVTFRRISVSREREPGICRLSTGKFDHVGVAPLSPVPRYRFGRRTRRPLPGVLALASDAGARRGYGARSAGTISRTGLCAADTGRVGEALPAARDSGSAGTRRHGSGVQGPPAETRSVDCGKSAAARGGAGCRVCRAVHARGAVS